MRASYPRMTTTTAHWRAQVRGRSRKAIVPAPDITFQLLDGRQAAGHVAELQALHAEVYADPPYLRDDDAAQFASRFLVQRRQPGFVLAEARSGGYLVGYAAGMPLRPSTSWWKDLTTALPDEVTSEHPGRTFALTELLVRAPWRARASARPCTTSSSAAAARNGRHLPCSRRPPQRRTPSRAGAGTRSLGHAILV